jgi:hypothetical protein
MSEWSESSVVVRTVRWLGQDSVIAGACRGVWRGLQRFDAAIVRAAADKDPHGDDERLRSVLEGSKVFQALDRLFSAPSLAWQDSRARGVYESTRAAFLELPMWQRVRLLGWMVLVALGTRIALYVFSRAEITRVTLLLWGLVAAVSALMMIAPQPVAAAWTDWRARRAGR